MNITAVVGLGLSLALGLQTHRLTLAERDYARLEAFIAGERSASRDRYIAADKVERAKEEDLRTKLKEALNANKLSRSKVILDAGSSRDAGERLRYDLAAYRVAGCPGTRAPTGVAERSPTTESTERVLADVQRRLDTAAERIAQFADESYLAGRTCERLYDNAEAVK